MDTSAEAGPSKPQPGASSYHESSQYLHWRYSPASLSSIREELNEKSKEVVARNTELEKEAQQHLGHEYTEPPKSTAYLTVQDELLLLRFYCLQISNICRKGFGLPALVEATAITYLKRFYLKNSVMEWHPKTIMPTSLYLAAKTTNHPIPMDVFIPKFAKLQAADVLDTEFLVAQSLGFEFWVRGGEKALRGWGLEFQSMPKPHIPEIQSALPHALSNLHTSRFTDTEFLFTPSQIALACWQLANPSLVSDLLDWRYDDVPDEVVPYGVAKEVLEGVLREIRGMIRAGEGEVEVDMKAVKGVDKRLRGCTNPEKVPGTALYAKRKREQETASAALRTAKTLKANQAMNDREMVFGDVIRQDTGKKAMSPRVSLSADRPIHDGNTPGIGETGMGVKDEAMGNVLGGEGLVEVGAGLDET